MVIEIVFAQFLSRCGPDCQNAFQLVLSSYPVSNTSANDKQNIVLLFLMLYHSFSLEDMGDHSIHRRIRKTGPNIFKLTVRFVPCRRKNVLQDVQVMRSKLIPRATSSQTRQINGKPQLRFVFIIQMI